MPYIVTAEQRGNEIKIKLFKKILYKILFIFLIINTFDFILIGNSQAATWHDFPDFNTVGEPYTIDEYDGVPAYINSKSNGKFGNNSSYYQCTEYVARYLHMKYGTNYSDNIDINNSNTQGFEGNDFHPNYSSNPPRPTVEKGTNLITLNQVSMPQSGDILVRTNPNHVAVIKSVNGNVVTLIEQNWIWNDNGTYKYTTDRTINITDANTFFYTFPPQSIEKPTDCIGNVCWAPQSASCDNAQSWYRLNDTQYAEITDSSSCTQINQEIDNICSSESINEAVPDEHWWQSWWRSFLNTYILIPTACGADVTQYIVSRTILIDNNGQASVSSGNGTSITDATGQGYESPATGTPTPALPDFTEYNLKLQDTKGNERYTYYLYDDKMEMHYWSTNIGEADWAGDAELIYVRFYLSKGYKARNSPSDWVRVGTEQIKKGNLNVGAIKHEWHTLDLTEYYDNGYMEPDHVYNIVVCVDRAHDTDNGDGDVPEMHESSIPTAEREALVALYDSTNGAGWSNSTGWKTNSDPCTWYGVICSGGHVTYLTLSNNQLSGLIPAEIGNLTNLTYL